MKTNRFLKLTFASSLFAFGLINFVGCGSDDDASCTPTTWYEDSDNDELGNPNVSTDACDQPEGYVADNTDEDDTVAFCEVSTWYQDIDEDGLGNPDVSTQACDQPQGYVENSDDDLDALFTVNYKYTVGAALVDDGAGYFVPTGDLISEPISIVGNGYEGYANLSVSLDGFFYDWNDAEQTVDKYEFTDSGLEKVDAVVYSSLFPETTWRYVQATGTGDLLLSSNPRGGVVPYMIIGLENFTIDNYGSLELPEYNGKVAVWAQPIVKDNKIYFSAEYGWVDLPNELITVKLDYPSMTNAEVITTDKSAGSVAGYRSNAAFKTEDGVIYQHNLTSIHWYEWAEEDDELADSPSVFVRIVDGEYDDDYVLDISANYDEKIAIWNAWYAGDNIAYANIVKESDLAAEGFGGNIGTLVEVNLETGVITELNIPQAPFINLFKAECVDDGKFYIPVSISGGDANVYEITIGGGANGFQKGASLDGTNVYGNAIYNNF